MLAGRMAQEILRLFLVSATRKVSALLRQVRIGVGLDLDVSFDAKVFEAYYFVMPQYSFDGFRGGRKRPIVPRNLPVMAMQPFPGLFRVPSAHHPPELLLDIFVDTYKSFPCHHMAVLIPPAAKRLIELLDQDRHWCADVFAD